MNTREIHRPFAIRAAAPVLVATAVATVLWVSAGDLNPPPGAIMPTDRVQLSDQVTTLPHTITQSGSYVLTSNLIGSSGLDGIIIDANEVTLDLNGFSLIGVAGSLDGIRINGPHANIAIHGGMIVDWDVVGLNAATATGARIEALSIGSSGLDGLLLGSDSSVRILSITGCGGAAIHVAGARNRVEATHVTSSDIGIDVDGEDNLIVKNNASGNTTDYDIAAGNAYGPIAVVGSVGDVSPVPASHHPWANFSHECAPQSWCADVDGDGFGDAGNTQFACAPPFGYVADCSDCNDLSPLINPNELEICDGLDNNCDGTADEGDPGGGGACDTKLPGICGPGTQVCQFAALRCVQIQQEEPELCDGLDNNCNGAVDDGMLPPPCTMQEGVCSGSVRVCGGTGGWLPCSSLQYGLGYEPVEVSCDGLDNDCDRFTDENLVEPCFNQQGVCNGAEQFCVAGAWSCDYAPVSGYEADEVSCDLLDNDCDGSVDEALVEPCANQQGVCSGGLQYCNAGSWSCDLGSIPNYEAFEVSCDALDNDCDSAIDEGLVELCDNQQGVCNGSLQYCTSGSWSCNLASNPNYEPLELSCDGLDNDCDGQVDEGRCPNGTACTSHTPCASSMCMDGFCCNSVCFGLCLVCDWPGNEGSCRPVPHGQDPDNECPGSGFCTSSGQCCWPSGMTCNSNSECCSGNCLSNPWGLDYCD